MLLLRIILVQHKIGTEFNSQSEQNVKDVGSNPARGKVKNNKPSRHLEKDDKLDKR